MFIKWDQRTDLKSRIFYALVHPFLSGFTQFKLKAFRWVQPI